LGGQFMAIAGKHAALVVAREKRPGLYGDGGGLYLHIIERGSKSWIYRFWVAERDPTTDELVRDPATKKVRGRAREKWDWARASLSPWRKRATGLWTSCCRHARRRAKCGITAPCHTRSFRHF
jgi:hypothetical protein